MLIACCISNATHTHTLRMCNATFPRQQWLRERASILVIRTLSCYTVTTPNNTMTTVSVPYPATRIRANLKELLIAFEPNLMNERELRHSTLMHFSDRSNTDPRKKMTQGFNAFETWSWRRMLKMKWTDRITNDEVFQRAKEERLLLNISKTDATHG